jgi:hypothetical protein
MEMLIVGLPGRMNRSSDVNVIKEQIFGWMYPTFEGVVQSGPFKGMRLPYEKAWKETYLPPMLLGCYEEELHSSLETQIARLNDLPNPVITVVGCAEGYYAIGLKLRVPKAKVYAVDIDDTCLEICKKAATMNGVELVFDATMDVYLQEADFIFMDVEGAETLYLNPDEYPKLVGIPVIVELHDQIVTYNSKYDTSNKLLTRFRDSHHILWLFEGERNPNKYDAIACLCADYKWMAVNEGRPTLMSWFVMKPKGKAVT